MIHQSEIKNLKPYALRSMLYALSQCRTYSAKEYFWPLMFYIPIHRESRLRRQVLETGYDNLK